MISDTVRLKLQDLIERAPSLVADGAFTLVGAHHVPRDTHHMVKCSAWITEALNVISYAIPSPQNPYRAQIEHAGEGTKLL